MELTAKRKMKRTAPRVPCKELNFQFAKNLQETQKQKPVNIKNLSIQVSQKTSADNSFSLSPMRPALPLYLVTSSNANISSALQQQIKSRSNSKTQKKTQTPKNSFFSRNQEWKKITNSKILRLKQEKDNFEISQCTFAPNIHKYSEKNRLSSRRASEFRELFCTNDESMLKDQVKDISIAGIDKKTFDLREIKDKTWQEDEIERSFLRITKALDTISRQIVETIEAEEKV